MSSHVLPVRTYLTIFGALAALTALTTWAAFQNLGSLEIVVALTIAVAKALLVMLFFMHLKYSNKLTWVFAGAAAVWFIFLITLLMADVDTRVVIG